MRSIAAFPHLEIYWGSPSSFKLQVRRLGMMSEDISTLTEKSTPLRAEITYPQRREHDRDAYRGQKTLF